MLVESSHFVSNSNSKPGSGGSVFFSSSGQCVHSRVCSFQSCIPSSDYITYKGVFCYVSVSASQDSQNKVVDSSICSSGKETFSGCYNLYMRQGSPVIDSVNISDAKIYYRILFEFDSINGNSSVSRSTFVNNSDYNDYYATAFQNDVNLNASINYCNFHQNKCNVVLNTYGPSLYISDCSIYKNTVSLSTFGYNNKPKVFLVERCYVDNKSRRNDSIKIESPIDEYFSVKLSHYSTGQCEAALPILFFDNRVFIRVISYKGCKFTSALSVMDRTFMLSQ